jgi:signal transduction histidine kinase/CheY-like chemotaxis protein
VALDRIVRNDEGQTFLLTLAMSPHVLEHVFADQQLPTGWTGSLVDQSTHIIARNEDSDHYLGRSVTAPAARAMAHSQEGVVDSVSQLGQPTLLAFTRSNLTGWWLLVGLPEGEAALPIDRAVTLLAPLIFALLGGGALLVALTLRRVGASLRTVAELAARVGRGEAVEAMTTGVSETDAIARVLHSASVKLRERDAELRRAAHLLEQRVEARTAELAAAHNQLAQSQKLEAVGQLTGGVAHDFNNLLTIIRSSIDFLQRPDLSEERRQRYIRAIADTVERASKLTGQLLAFARRQPLKPEVFDVDERVRNTVDLVTPLVGPLVQITIHPCSDACYAYADPGQLETALVNLLINARDAMNGEGEISVAVSWAEAIPAVRGHPPRRGAFVAIRVADTGEGIAPDRIEAIFEPFYTTKGVGKGTGLGLSQVFGFVKQSDGEVEVQSAPGAGAAFTIYLPRSTDAPMAGAPKVYAPARQIGRGGCILVVEDNEAVGQFSTEMIQDLGYSTVWVSNAADALAMLEAADRRFDLVFSDVIMPGMNGVDLAREIKMRNATLPVILTSGYSDVLASQEGREFELVQKPYSAETLARALHRAMAE